MKNCYVTAAAWRELVAACKRYLDDGAASVQVGNQLARKIALVQDNTLAHRFVEAAKRKNPKVGRAIDDAYGYHYEDVAERYFADGFHRSHAQEVMRLFGAGACTQLTIARAASAKEEC